VIHRSIPKTRRSPPPCAPWSAPARARRPGIEARTQYDALMESVAPRGDVTFAAATLGGVPGLWVHPGMAARRSDRPSARGCSTLAPPGRTAIWSGRSPRERSEALSRTIGCSRTSISGCHGRRAGMLPRTCRARRAPDCAHRDSAGGNLALDSRPPATRLSSELPCVAGDRPDAFGRELRDARMPIPCLPVRSRGARCIPTGERRRETTTGFAASRSIRRHACHPHSRR